MNIALALVLIFAGLTLLSLVTMYWLYTKERNTSSSAYWKDRKLAIQASRGWIPMSLKEYLRTPGIQDKLDSISVMTSSAHEAVVSHMDWINFRDRSRNGIFVSLVRIGQNAQSAQSLHHKRMLTISAIYYDHAIPIDAYCLDEVATGMLNIYIAEMELQDLDDLCEKYQDQHTGIPLEEYSTEELIMFKTLASKTTQAIQVFLSMRENHYPNLVVLTHWVRSMNPDMHATLNEFVLKRLPLEFKDEQYNQEYTKLLKYWLSIQASTLMLMVPKQYILLNDFVVEHHKRSKRYSGGTPPTLIIVDTTTQPPGVEELVDEENFIGIPTSAFKKTNHLALVPK